MEWLNYHHLFYFWTVARHGSIASACVELRLSPPTLSTQIRQLEASLGEPLFVRERRRLVLTDVGRTVQGYADEIFSRGREMLDTVKRRQSPSLRLVVGVSDVLPKLVAWRLLQPALSLPGEVRVVCREDRHDRLLAALAVHDLDVVLSDAPATAAIGVRAFNHALGECGVSFFAAPTLAATLRGRLPLCLDGAPILLPTDVSALRLLLDGWFERHGVRPRVVGEFDDGALLKTFGQAGAGVFAAPSVIETEVTRQHSVRIIGRTTEIRERFYAISADRRLKHPAVVALTGAARHAMFG
jgi:LysR family transcriptional regulator, transcriptional activator of nhaA